jgi:hypothetical protein
MLVSRAKVARRPATAAMQPPPPHFTAPPLPGNPAPHPPGELEGNPLEAGESPGRRRVRARLRPTQTRLSWQWAGRVGSGPAPGAGGAARGAARGGTREAGDERPASHSHECAPPRTCAASRAHESRRMHARLGETRRSRARPARPDPGESSESHSRISSGQQRRAAARRGTRACSLPAGSLLRLRCT